MDRKSAWHLIIVAVFVVVLATQVVWWVYRHLQCTGMRLELLRRHNAFLQHEVAHEIGEKYPLTLLSDVEDINRRYPDLELIAEPEPDPLLRGLMGPTGESYRIVPSEDFEPGLGKYRRKEAAMFISEGAFFILVLLVAAAVLHARYTRERDIARRQELLINAISHEMNTPLAAIRLSLDTMMRRQEFVAGAKYLKRLRLASLRLAQMIRAVLDTQWVENPRRAVQWSNVKVRGMIEEVLGDLKETTDEEGVKIDLEVPEDLVVCTDARALQVVVSNLIRNAVQFGGRPPVVRLEAGKSECGWWLAVEDNGSGVCEKERKLIFERFYSVSPQRSKAGGGTGLGLYLVSRILHLLRGNVRVYDGRVLSGARFLVSFMEVRRCQSGS